MWVVSQASRSSAGPKLAVELDPGSLVDAGAALESLVGATRPQKAEDADGWTWELPPLSTSIVVQERVTGD